MLRALGTSLVLMLLFTLLLGGVYPATVTLLSQVLFPAAASGGIVKAGDQAVGADMLGQEFTRMGYFWGRPAATEGGYDPSASAGSNLSATNPQLKDRIARRREMLMKTSRRTTPPPADLLYASGSGLDPHISPEAALWQVARVAAARQMDDHQLEALIEEATEPRQLGMLGEPRVNVLKLNLALDGPAHGR